MKTGWIKNLKTARTRTAETAAMGMTGVAIVGGRCVRGPGIDREERS
jgi:hypothetical protein